MTNYNSGNPYDAHLTFDGLPVTATTGELPQFSMQATSLEGVTGEVPAAVLDSVAFEFSANSTLQFKIAEGTPGYALVNEYSLMKLYMNGQLVDDGQWTVRHVKVSTAELKKTKEVTAFHRLWDALARTQVMTEAPAAPKRYFYSMKSPGHVLSDLVHDAKLRNVRTIKDLTWTFTGAVDSGGRAWPKVFSIEYRHGTDYASIFQNWVDRGEIEVRLRGNELQVFVADQMGRITAADLVVGRDITDAPVEKSAENVAGVVVMVGEDDVTVVRKNTTTIAAYGREEISDSQGGTSDVGSLSLVGDALVSNASKPRTQRTYGVVMRPGVPWFPLRDYAVSDYVRVSDIGEGMLMTSDSYRVRQLVLSFQGGQVYTASLVLNDKFLESEVRMAKKVAGIIGGAVVTGASRSSTPDDLKDKSVPNPPSSLSGSSGAYVDVNGVTKAQATLTWSPPTQNTDGTAIVDLSHYRVAWRYTDETVYRWQDTDDTILNLSPLDPGRDLLFYVRAIDTSGHWSTNPPPYVLTLGNDSTPPPKPSDPVLTSRQGTVGAAWDGLGDAGEPMPPDFSFVEVRASKVAAFDWESGKIQGHLSGAGDLLFFGYSIGDVVYVRFRAVDHSGNWSDPSDAVSYTVAGISGPDLMANSVKANHLDTGSVTARAIETGAVNAQKITIGQTHNLVPDPSFNDPIWRAKRVTAEYAEVPDRWFFTDAFIGRNGYYLQMLSTASGVNGGRMFMTDWLDVEMGEQYYVSCYDRHGQFTPNAEARLHIGITVEKTNGSILDDYMEVTPSSFWFRDGYQLQVQEDWKRIRYWVRAYRLHSGDLAIDDFEVRPTIGTTATAGGRIDVGPLGIKMYDDLDQLTVDLNSLFGDAMMRGTIQSGFTGKRIVVNPGSTYLPEIRFYPVTGNLYAYINSSDSGSYPFIGVNAPDTGAASMAMILYDTNWTIGEVNKATSAVVGAGVTGSGTGAGAFLTLYGKLQSDPTGLEALTAGKWSAINPSGQNPFVMILGKPAVPSGGGQYTVVYSIQRNDGQHFYDRITAESSTQAQIAMWTVNGAVFTATLMSLNYIFVRVV